MNKKRGASDVIIFVLLIGFAVAIALLVITWSTGYTKELTESGIEFVEKGIECEQVSINVKDISVNNDCSSLKITNKGYLKVSKVVVRSTENNELEAIPVITLEESNKEVGCKEKSIILSCSPPEEFGSEEIVTFTYPVNLMPYEEITVESGAPCIPLICDLFQCGINDDGCEGLTEDCGLCGANSYCSLGLCYCDSGYSDCDGDISLGSGGTGCECYTDGEDTCYLGSCCTPDCAGKVCGDDGCGGFCPPYGECTGGYCETGSCIWSSCKAILDAGIAVDGVYTIDPDGFGANLPFSVYCDMTTEGGGWTLFAITDATHCAENLPYGPSEIISLDNPAYLTTLLKDLEHESFLQIMKEDGLTTAYTITYGFGNTKTLRNRIDNAVASGESVTWTVNYDSNTYTYGPYLWWYSDNAGTSTKWDISGLGFSSDDGSWGGAPSNINGNAGPQLNDVVPSWGHENPNSGDLFYCDDSLKDGIATSYLTLRNYIFLR